MNFGEIILLPKINEAEKIQQYRPICLLNVSFKIFTKVATIRLNMIADHVVRPSQTVFMQGRNILDGVVTLHEIVHGLHSKKLNGVILKIDFEEAYDKVKLYFLQPTLRMTFFLMSGIEGVIPHLVDGELSILQYADDTILFMEHDLEKARNLKIDFCKSELFCFGDAQDEVNAYANLFECGQGSFL
jgi:hypothetical protein